MQERIQNHPLIKKLSNQALVKKLMTIPFMQKLLTYETISYIVCGVLTTIINWFVYFICDKIGYNTAISTLIAWILAVIFAYFVNKIYVFQSRDWSLPILSKEFVPFITCRILSGIFDILFMVVAVDYLHMMKGLAKLLSNVFVMIANYFASKFLIFKKH